MANVSRLAERLDGDFKCCGHLLSENLSSARAYNRRHTVRLNATTISAIRITLAARDGKSARSAAMLICAPSPLVLSTWPLNVTNSATMLAFHAPPAAVTHPVTRYGNTAGRYSDRKRSQRSMR